MLKCCGVEYYIDSINRFIKTFFISDISQEKLYIWTTLEESPCSNEIPYSIIFFLNALLAA